MPPAPRARTLAVLTVACLLASGCSSPIRYYSCNEPSQAHGFDTGKVWRCNLDVMQRVAKGKRFSLREFWGAADFFAGLTGIEADMRETPQGKIPGPGLADNLRSWKDWYVQHGNQLVWDPSTGSVRLQDPGNG